jgi:hypothetical protein
MKIQFCFLETELFQPVGLELSCTGIVLETNEDYFFKDIETSDISSEMYPLAFYEPNTDSIHIFIEHKSFLIRDDAEKFAFLMFVLYHEASHRLLSHIKRGKDKDHMLWNVAADMEIHNMFKVYSSVMASNPKFSSSVIWYNTRKFINEFLFEKRNPEKAEGLYEEEYLQNVAEEIYADLINSEQTESHEFSFNSSAADGHQVSGKITTSTYKTKAGKTFTSTNVEIDKIDQDGSEGSSDREDSQASNDAFTRKTLLDNIIQKYFSEFSRQKGEENNQFRSFLKKLFHVKIDWKKILRSSLRTALDKSEYFSWAKPRTSLFGMKDFVYLPAQCEEESKYGTLIVARDESGSITNDECSQAASIILESKNYFKKVIVLKHDVKITSVKEFTEADDGLKNHLLERESFGGTSHEDVFNWIKHYSKKHLDEDMISCCIFITDMESDIEETQSIIDDSIPRIYLVPSSYERHAKESRSNKIKGKIIAIES